MDAFTRTQVNIDVPFFVYGMSSPFPIHGYTSLLQCDLLALFVWWVKCRIVNYTIITFSQAAFHFEVLQFHSRGITPLKPFSIRNFKKLLHLNGIFSLFFVISFVQLPRFFYVLLQFKQFIDHSILMKDPRIVGVVILEFKPKQKATVS